MHTTKIQDWQFGQLHWEDDWGWCAKGVEWMPGQTIDLSIQTDLTESNTIPERTRIFFNAFRNREKEFISLAAQDMLDGFNEIGEDSNDPDDRPKGWPFTVPSIIDDMSLYWVMIAPDDDSELQYLTWGPLIHVIISPDLEYKEAFGDCPG